MEMMALDKESYPSIAHSLPFRSFHRLSEGYVCFRLNLARLDPFHSGHSKVRRSVDQITSSHTDAFHNNLITINTLSSD